MKITAEQSAFLEEFLNETGFEIWNAGCTHRLSIGRDWDKPFAVSEYHDPLHPVKEYSKVQSAINFMIKKDEE